MDSQTETTEPPLRLKTEQPSMPALNGSVTTTSTRSNTALSSAPPTPNPSVSALSRPPHPATSPIQHGSPKVVRRTSSSIGLNERPASSPNPLRKKSSRASLSGQIEEEQDKRLTPKRSISNLITGLREAQARMELIEEPVPLTAPQIAADHFTRELLAHSQPETEAETAVILHDACYGHRYSRLKTNKTMLSLIVERPERIHASVLGASTAYVRLGGHHAGARNAPQPQRRNPSTPPFKIRRTARTLDITSSHVTNVHGTAWMSELRGMCEVAGEKLAAGAKELDRSTGTTDSAKRHLHEGDLYLCSESLNAFQGALGGVADAVDTVFDETSRTRRAFVAVRPPGHHCSADFPSGFCWLNNVHVGIEYGAQTYGLTHAAIIDFDLHHGDGSQAITWERNSKNNGKRLAAKPNSKLKLGPDIGYYSLHDINSYPCETGDDEKVQAASLCIENAHGQNIWNVHLQPWKTEKDFWELYESRYRVLLHKARTFLQSHTARFKAEGKVVPKAAIFISAGFDASEWEGSGMQRHKVNVPTEFYARFTRDMVELAQEDGTGCQGRVISVLEGGYSDRALCSGVLSHLSGLCAVPVESIKSESAGMDSLDQMMRELEIGLANETPLQYNKAWWSPANLTALEMKVNPPPPPQAKKTRVGQQPTYATPTESFAYKVVDANKFARSISGTMREVPQPARPPTPPPPEVDWSTATQELLKLLIPSSRQTRSCTAEELAGPRIRKEVTSTASTADNVEPMKPRQLRDRKTKAFGYAESTHSDETESLRSVSRNSRRQTIAELPSASAAPPEPSHQRRASRRLSASSALSSIAGDLDTPAPPPVPPFPTNIARGPSAVPSSAQGPPKDLNIKKPRAVGPKPQAPITSPVSPKRPVKAPIRAPSVATTEASQPSNDVDALAAGLRKVTLKVGSREEHDRKQKEKLDAERRARALKAAETRKANAAAKKAAKENAVPSKPLATQAQKENNVPIPPSSSPPLPLSQAQPPIPLLPDNASVHVAQQNVSLDRLSSATAASEQGYAATIAPSNIDMHTAAPMLQQGTFAAQPQAIVPHQMTSNFLPENQMNAGPPPSLSLYEPQQHQYPTAMPTAPSNMFAPSLPAAARSPGGSKLPVWSSTGVIPFAVPNGHPPAPVTGSGLPVPASAVGFGTLSNQSGQGEGPTRSVWDVPDTPQR